MGIITRLMTLVFILNASMTSVLPNSQNNKTFDAFFKLDKKIIINTDNLEVGGLREVIIDSNDHLIFLDPSGCQVLVFNQEGEFLNRIGGKGEGPGEFVLPLTMGKNSKGNLYISDSRMRRINQYNQDGAFVFSFFISPTHWPPSIVRIDSQKNLFMAGLKADFENKGPGTWINKYHSSGKLEKSFLERNTEQAWLRSMFPSFCFDMDEKDNLYAIQINEYKFLKFDREGNPIESFGQAPKYFIEPDSKFRLDYSKYKTMEELREIMTELSQSWTRIVDLSVFQNNYLLLVLEANDLVDRINEKYIMDIWDLDGHLIKDLIPTNYKYLCADQKGYVYFLIFTDEEEALEKPPRYIIGKYLFQNHEK